MASMASLHHQNNIGLSLTLILKVGESSRVETAITVTGLRPNNFYAVRMVATSPTHFHASSKVIQLKTKRAIKSRLSSSADPNQDSSLATQHQDNTPHLPSIEPVPVAHSATIVSQESANPFAHGRRLTNNRKSPAVGPTAEASSSASLANGDSQEESSEGEPSVQQLTETLESLRREAEDIQRQTAKEEEEFEVHKAALLKERDTLKHSLREKDDASAELRKEVANLDRQNRTAQSRRITKEKELQQKIDERMKMKQDMTNWARDIEEMSQDIARWSKAKEEIRAASEEQNKTMRLQISEDQKAIKALEEEIKTKGVQIKELEEERKKIQGSGDDEAGRERARQAEEEELKWEITLRELQVRYGNVMNGLQQAQENHRQAQERLAWWNARGINHPSDFSRLSAVDFEVPGSKKGKQRRSRHRKSRTNTISSTSGSQTSDARMPPIGTASPALAVAATVNPFFNMGNGTTVSAPSHESVFGQADVDQLTGGAPMSPTANALLPANLLGDEDSPANTFTGGMPIGPAFGGNAFSSIGPGIFDNLAHDLNSPASSGSRSESVFSSPRGSLNNLATYPSAPDSLAEGDRRSIHSNAASLGAIGVGADGTPSSSRKFSNLFNLNLNRQRGKTMENEPPPLGSLKPGQSHSFPVEQPDLDPIGTKRRKGTHTNSWVGPMTNFSFLGRNAASATTSEGNAPAPIRTVTSRRKPFNMFSSKYDPFEPSKILGEPSSPRPSSISSSENALPRPSSDARPFGWPTADGAGHRSSPLGADWSIQTAESWSRDASRRNSIRHGSGTSVGATKLPFDAESFQSLVSDSASPSAPIESKPDSSQDDVPKLNPAAPTFKTIFSRSEAKKAERAEKAERAAERAAEREMEKDLEWLREDSSPTENRHSRDDYSIATEESVASHESLDHSLSGTPSESTTPSALGGKDRQSIFQKITRKSSSSKFNIPWKDKAGLFSKKAVDPPTPGEMEEEESGGSQVGKSVESVGSSPQLGSTVGRSSISWNTLRRKTKKGDKTASEASERASETGDDEE